MLALWYIILGWKKYNKCFTEQVDFPPDHLPKKQDSKTEKKDGTQTQPVDIRKSDFPKSPSNFPRGPEMPKPSLPKDIPAAAEGKKSNPPFGIPDSPKMPEPAVSPQIPEKPILPEIPKFSLVNPKAPEPGPKAAPKVPESVKVTPKSSPEIPDSPKVPDVAKTPEPGPPKSPTSGLSQEFLLPPYLPGSSASNQKPAMTGDELFAMGTDLRNPQKSNADLRDLSYGRGEFSESEPWKKPLETTRTVPRYKDETRVSNPDSVGSSEDEVTDEE